MLRRSSIRARAVIAPLVPALVLVAFVAFDVRRSPGVIVAAVVAAVAGVALALVLAATVTRPLRELTALASETALDLEGTRTDTLLPPRELRAGREVGDLAAAIAAGRHRASDLLAEERLARRSVTDLVAHLALRNDRLLGAALDALGELARRDHDPATGAALARVHRLVARVDRATASALVLIGEGGRLAAAPATLRDIAWSATLAVESADRVEMVSLANATVHADAVLDVAHLLAELIDNAVSASAPPARVTVLGQAGADGGYVVSVVDAGAGLDAEALEQANRRVRRLVPVSRVPTRHVGLDVVGRLARRHGIGVRLGASAGGGVVVRVELPAALLGAPVIETVEPSDTRTIVVTELSPVPAIVPAHVDLVAAERAEREAAATATTTRLVDPRGRDDVLPKRDHRKWAAALQRARS